MRAQSTSPPETPNPQRGLIRKWVLVVLLLALIWNLRGAAVKYVPAAILSLVPSSDVVGPSPDAGVPSSDALASPVPGPIQTQAQPVAGARGPVDARATAPSSSPRPANQNRAPEFSGRSPVPTPERSGPPGYSVQVAAFPDFERARTLSEQLSRAGYSVYLTTATVNQVQFHRVRVGPFESRRAAQEVAQRLETQGHEVPWITQ